MQYNTIDFLKQVVVPIFELEETGAVKPNPLFHRPIDKLHSRCIEYPFAASQIGSASSILDVGTVKSDPAWIAWLENLPMDVHATDYDKPIQQFLNIKFHRADVRELPIPDNTFDKIFAISVIEHIGLHNPQVIATALPQYSVNGDIEAMRELVRVLKRGGELIMTFPFGLHDVLILRNEARNYTIESIKKFEAIAEPVLLDYYEYQFYNYTNIYTEYSANRSLIQKLHDCLWSIGTKHSTKTQANHPPTLPGAITWRKIPLENARALHHEHVEGVLCSVWRKN